MTLDQVRQSLPSLSASSAATASSSSPSSFSLVLSLSERRDYSSNFPPGLVIENIPGLSFEGYNRKPNRRIAVEHVVSSGEELALDEDGNDDLCPTESTTSRFEKAEKMV